ncbi:MAG: HAMP domain-containing methyl-accepting chemotaxis protein [Vicinamibacterales bacterium]
MTPAAAPDVRNTRAVPVATEASVAAIAEVCERASKGDLEARVIGLVDHPEFGRLARAINAMLDGADSFVREAAAAMENCSHDQFHRPILLRGLKGGYRQSAGVINAAGVKMRDNREGLTFVGRLAAENNENVKTVADAVAELSETSNHIAREASNAARATQQTVTEAKRAGEAVAAMTAAVGAIDGMVALINKVAAQTNLLALNATIEAARAGDAGKGFAVVASEVKELSRDTAKATGDISTQVEKIRGTVDEVRTLIETIGAAIHKIDAGAGTIAETVSEQVRATAEITRSIGEVAENTRQVSERMSSRQPAAGKTRAA